ncbi:MAG: carcinine hydrolase/isopenicillin-N N-acyltransferase family protein, partial [Gaiellaceae bacterium]
SDDREGVPRVLVSRHALEAVDRADAVRRAGLAGRAGGYAHVLALPAADTFSIETTAGRLAVLDGPGGHTNHYLDPELAEVGSEPSESSLARYARLAELLAERPPQTPEDAMATLRDDGLAPQGDPATAVLFAMVCEVESGRMWVAPGDPREMPYEEVDLAGVV